MKLSIKERGWPTVRLDVEDGGIAYAETLKGRRRFSYNQIDGVLLAPDGKLSVQVGEEIFTVQTNADEGGHHPVIDALVERTRRAPGGSGDC
jgi:hypothetical protein